MGDRVMKIEYFGTSLTEKGHYIYHLGKYGLDYEKDLNINKYPFQVERLNDNTEKGSVLRTHIQDYKILHITGSCIDKRPGCKSVFITQEAVTLKDFEDYIRGHDYCKKMFEQMDFEIKW